MGRHGSGLAAFFNYWVATGVIWSQGGRLFQQPDPMKHIPTAIVAIFASFALVCCGSKKGDSEASAMSHSEIADGVAAEMTTMFSEMAKIKDVASAEAFAEKMPAIKSKLKQYLASAQGIEAPTDAQKADFKTKMEQAQEANGPAMMAMMMGMSQNPDSDAIGKVLEGAMDDDEMGKVMEKLEGIYTSDEQEAESAPAE